MQAINSSEFFNKEYLAALGIAQASLALLLLARNLNSFNIGCAQHSSSKLDSAFACTKFKFFQYLATLGIVQASLTLLSFARYFFFEEVFSPWHSKQVSSAHDLAKTFLNFFDFRENGRYIIWWKCYEETVFLCAICGR